MVFSTLLRWPGERDRNGDVLRRRSYVREKLRRAEVTQLLRGAPLMLSIGFTAAAAAMSVWQPAVVAIAALGGVTFVARFHPTLTAVLLVLATFCSRFSLSVGETLIRPEMVLALAAGTSLLVTPPSLLRRRPLGFLLPILFWLSWLFVVTAIFAPVPTKSMSVYVWLCLDLAAVLYLVLRVEEPKPVVSWGIWLCLLSEVLALTFWALATAGGPRILVQEDPTYGGYAAYVGVFEANILAGIVVLWALVAQSTRLASHVSAFARVSVTALSIPVAFSTHTRAALIAGFLVVSYAAFRRGGRMLVNLGLPLIGGAVLLMGGFIDIRALGLEKFGKLTSFQEGTGHYRAVTWDAALHDMTLGGLGSHLHGLGLNSFGQRHLDPSLPGSGVPWYLGNVALQTYYDGGVVAVLIIVGFIAVMLNRQRSWGCALFVLTYLVIGLSTSTIWLLQSWIFVALGTFLMGGASARLGTTKGGDLARARG